MVCDQLRWHVSSITFSIFEEISSASAYGKNPTVVRGDKRMLGIRKMEQLECIFRKILVRGDKRMYAMRKTEHLECVLRGKNPSSHDA